MVTLSSGDCFLVKTMQKKHFHVIQYLVFVQCSQWFRRKSNYCSLLVENLKPRDMKEFAETLTMNWDYSLSIAFNSQFLMLNSLLPPITCGALCNKSCEFISVGLFVLSLKQNTATEETDLEPSKCYSYFMP